MTPDTPPREPMDEGQPRETPIADLRRNTLAHYEKVSLAAHEWHSIIPQAINRYFDERERLAALPPARPAEPTSEDEDRNAFKAHVVRVIGDAMAELNICRDSGEGSMVEQFVAYTKRLAQTTDRAWNDAKLGRELVQALSSYAGDGGETEGAVKCLARLLRELDGYRSAPLPSGEPTSEAVVWTCAEHGTGKAKCCDYARQVRDDYAEIANPVVDHSTPLRPDWRTDAKVHEAIVRILRKRATGDLAQKLMNEDPFTSLEDLYAVCDAVAEVYAHPAAPSPAVGQGEPTFAEVAAAIGNIVGPTQSGVTFHDATPDWSVVAEHDGEVIARGEDVPAMLRALVADDKTMQTAIKAALKASPRFPLAGEHNA